MYAFIYYDKERDMEPIAFAGSYFQNSTFNGINTPVGKGYVMFVDPNYRGLKLGQISWLSEAKYYNDMTKENGGSLELPLQYEIQNEYSVQSTLSCFPSTENDCQESIFGNHNSNLTFISNGRIKNDGTRCQIRLIMNYKDKNLIGSFNRVVPKNLQEIYNKPDWRFMSRENLTDEDLLKYWR